MPRKRTRSSSGRMQTVGDHPLFGGVISPEKILLGVKLLVGNQFGRERKLERIDVEGVWPNHGMRLILHVDGEHCVRDPRPNRNRHVIESIVWASYPGLCIQWIAATQELRHLIKS